MSAVARTGASTRTRTAVRRAPRASSDAAVRRTVLPSGITVITETVPTARSVSIGVWVSVGSRDETPSLAGVTHFLEHLLFKGTRTRSAAEISAAIDGVGGELNAFTGKEYTCYHARVLDHDVELAVTLLSDMLVGSTLPAAEVRTERDVILEEIAMNDDDPDETVHDAFVSALFGDIPIGRPIVGTSESIGALTRRQVVGYFRRRYRPDRLVVSAAGNVDHRVFVGLIRRGFAAAAGSPAVPYGLRRTGSPPSLARESVRLVTRPTEQATFLLGVPGLSHCDERRFAANILSTVLGGGTSSRLFQEVRERRGLAYSVYSVLTSYADTGYVAVGGGCLPDKLGPVLEVVGRALGSLAADGVTTEELDRAKGQLRGSFVLGLEDTFSQMIRLARGELVYGDLLSIDEVLARIDAVTLDDVAAVGAELLRQPATLAVVGPYTDESELGRT